MLLAAFEIWPIEKFDSFRIHMDVVLERPELTEQQIQEHAYKFVYLPPNAVIRRSNSQPLINKPTYEQ